MKKIETAIVPFHGHPLLTTNDGDIVRVAMKPICEAIGLDWSAQFRRIKRHPVLGSTVAMMATVAGGGIAMMATPSDGGAQDTVTLPLDFLNGWLFGIDASRVKPEIRDRLIDYQRECFAALAAYWQQGVATNPRARAATIPQLLATGREIRKLLQELKRETNPAVRRTLYAQLEQHCRLISIPTPALEEIGQDAVPDHESPLLEAFWDIVDALQQQPRNQIDHSRKEELVALNLPQVYAAAAAAKMTLPDMSTMRRLLRACLAPCFVAVKAVNSAHVPGTVKCWVFSQQPATQSARH